MTRRWIGLAVLALWLVAPTVGPARAQGGAETQPVTWDLDFDCGVAGAVARFDRLFIQVDTRNRIVSGDIGNWRDGAPTSSGPTGRQFVTITDTTITWGDTTTDADNAIAQSLRDMQAARGDPPEPVHTFQVVNTLDRRSLTYIDHTTYTDGRLDPDQDGQETMSCEQGKP